VRSLLRATSGINLFTRSSLELAWLRVGFKRHSLFVWTCLASAAFAIYPNESVAIDLSDRNASADGTPRQFDRAPNETFNFAWSSFIENSWIPGGPVREYSSVAQADERIARRRADLLSHRDLVNDDGLEEGALYANSVSIFPAVKRHAREFLVFDDVQISSKSFDLGRDGIQEPPRNVGDAATQCCGRNCLLTDIIKVCSSSSSEGKKLVSSNLQNLASAETNPSANSIPSDCPLGPLGVSRDEKRITYVLDHDLSSTDSSQTTDDKEPKYVKITALDQAIGGWFEKDTHASVFQLPQADIDVSFDGKIWFHAFGPRCVKSEPRFKTTKDSN
jgi:hypothetical protein